MDKIKVLLVEDEATLAMIIKDTLEVQNFRDCHGSRWRRWLKQIL
jgi:DNA-binding response OmpR family regulator